MVRLMVEGVGSGRRWRSNPSGKCSQERLTRGTLTSTMTKAANPPGGARCGAGAGCSAIKYQSLSVGSRIDRRHHDWVGLARESGRVGLRAVPIGTVLNLRTTTSQKCEAVPRRSRT